MLVFYILLLLLTLLYLIVTNNYDNRSIRAKGVDNINQPNDNYNNYNHYDHNNNHNNHDNHYNYSLCLNNSDCINGFCLNDSCHPIPLTIESKFGISYVEGSYKLDGNLLCLYNNRFILFPALYSITEVQDVVELDNNLIVLVREGIYIIHDLTSFNANLVSMPSKIDQLFVYRNILHKLEDKKIYQYDNGRWLPLQFLMGRDIRSLSVERVVTSTNPFSDDIIIELSNQHRYCYHDGWQEDILTQPVIYKIGRSLDYLLAIYNNKLSYTLKDKSIYLPTDELDKVIDAVWDSNTDDIIALTSYGIVRINSNGITKLIGEGKRLIATSNYVWLIQ